MYAQLTPFSAYQEGQLPTIPFIDQPVMAGFPSPADDFLDNSLDLNELLVKHPAATFFFRVNGNAMYDIGIYQDDILVVDRSLTAESGMVIVAVVQGELLIRRYEQKGSQVFLHAANADFAPVSITADVEFEVWGVVTSVIHKVQ